MLLINLLADSCKLYSGDFEISDQLVVNNKTYNLDPISKGNNGFIGFFDWLRRDSFTIIGIRMCFFEDQGYNKLFRKLPYVKSSFDEKCIEITFIDAAYNADLSGDQDFSQNYIYKSVNDYLVTFNLDHLTEKEFESLRSYISPM
jgi:hypothetical protein